jgi:hypothetical protein
MANIVTEYTTATTTMAARTRKKPNGWLRGELSVLSSLWSSGSSALGRVRAAWSSSRSKSVALLSVVLLF